MEADLMQWWANLGSVVTAVATTVTMGVLIWYTIETFRLRKAAQKQNEIAIMPIIVVQFESAQRSLGERMRLLAPRVRNIGSGPAFNVSVARIGVDSTEVTFDSVPVLECGKDAELRFLITQNGATTGLARNIILLESVMETRQLGIGTTVSVSFMNSTGVRYTSLHTVEYDSIENVTTRFQGQSSS